VCQSGVIGRLVVRENASVARGSQMVGYRRFLYIFFTSEQYLMFLSAYVLFLHSFLVGIFASHKTIPADCQIPLLSTSKSDLSQHKKS